MSMEDRVEWLSVRVKYCRTSKCYDKGKARLQWALNQSEEPDSKAVAKIMELAVKHLTAGGAVVKTGMAPMSGLEREVKKYIDGQ